MVAVVGAVVVGVVGALGGIATAAFFSFTNAEFASSNAITIAGIKKEIATKSLIFIYRP